MDNCSSIHFQIRNDRLHFSGTSSAENVGLVENCSDFLPHFLVVAGLFGVQAAVVNVELSSHEVRAHFAQEVV